MKATINKTLIKRSLSIVALSVAAFAAPAHAELFQDFQITAPNGAATFTADKISGNYVEVLTSTGATFATTAYANFTGFGANEGKPTTSNFGLNNDYNLYAIFTATGNVTNGGASFQGVTGNINLYLDPRKTTTGAASVTQVTLPSTGGAAPTIVNGSDDLLLGSTSSFVFGEGATKPGGVLNANGDFSLTFKDLLLTAAGQTYFTNPTPFFLMQFTVDGNFSNLDSPVNGTFSNITGNQSVFFATAVPEPTSIALLGLGLAGLALSRRRKQA